jgi:hypothetical protein
MLPLSQIIPARGHADARKEEAVATDTTTRLSFRNQVTGKVIGEQIDPPVDVLTGIARDTDVCFVKIRIPNHPTHPRRDQT